MTDHQQIDQALIPFVSKKSKGTPDQFCSFEGKWQLQANGVSETIQASVNSLIDQVNPQMEIALEMGASPEKSEYNYRPDLGYFQPRQPLYLLFVPESLTINPNLILDKIRWNSEWNIHDFTSTDEYHLIIGRFIQISSRSERGLYYGLQTLEQLFQFSDNAIPFQTIHDVPKTSIRALNIDWMIPDLDPHFIQEILLFAGKYKINAIIFADEAYTPTKQFELEFSKNFLSYGKFLSTTKNESTALGEISLPWTRWMIKLGLFPFLSYSLIWRAACLWEGRKIPEASFNSRYWRNFYFNKMNSTIHAFITNPKLPLIFTNLFNIFEEIPLNQYEFPLKLFLFSDVDRLTARFMAQQQTLGFFQKSMDAIKPHVVRNRNYFSLFDPVIKYCYFIQTLMQIRKQSRDTLNILFNSTNYENINDEVYHNFSQIVDHILQGLNGFSDTISQELGWFLQTNSSIRQNVVGLNPFSTEIRELSQSLNGFLQYREKFFTDLENFK